MQTLLVALNRFAPFRSGGRMLYKATGRLVGELCRALPEVQAMYLAGSMASGDIAPGLSDIDIVLVIDDLPAEREYQLIRRIEARLRYSLPPFGRDKAGEHLMIYSTDEWQVVGSILLGKQSGAPKAVFEKWTRFDYGSITPQTQSLHHLLKALWRFESFDIRADNRSDTRLETLLRLRMAERLVGAMESAVLEVSPSPLSEEDFSALAACLREEIDAMQDRSDDAGLSKLLPRLLECLDRAVSCCLPGPPWPETSTQWNSAREGVNTEPCQNLARELLGVLGEVPDGQSVYATRLKKTDFVVCDPLSEQTTRRFYDHYRLQTDRTFRIATPRIFDSLYLSAAFGPSKFVRLNDLAMSEVSGQIGAERFQLDVYSMFPRVRALKKLENQAVFTSYATSLDQLRSHIAGTEQTPSAAGESPDGGVGAEKRFIALRESSRKLADALRQYAIGPEDPIE